MVQYIGAAGMIVSLAVDVVIGVRMLMLARRTRRLPELLLALILLIGAVFGLSLLAIAQRVEGIPMDARQWIAATGLGGQYIGSVAMVIFAWQVFRPTASWARPLFLGFCAAMAAGLAVDLVTGTYAHYAEGSMHNHWFALGYALRSLAPLGLLIESVIFTRKLGRQRSVGLVDPLLYRRFIFWTAGVFGVVALYGIGFAFRVVTWQGPGTNQTVAMTLAIIACASAVCWALAFLGRSAAGEFHA